MRHEASPNHAYILHEVRRLAPRAGARILDFGSGTGFFVATARQAGIDAWGCDRFVEAFAGSRDAITPDLAPYIAALDQTRLPYPDGHFDLIVSNQVFEHVPPGELDGAVRELHRVLKPGGHCLVLFPTRDVWFEGHVGLYFPHWLANQPGLQRRYLETAHKLGRGYFRDDATPQTWAASRRALMQRDVFYHHWGDIRALWTRVFGVTPQSREAAYMRFRIQSHPRLARLAAVTAPAPLSKPLEAVCIRRAGRVFTVQKP